MIKNYFNIAFRNLWKNKGYAFINIAGLSIGLASFIIIVLYVNHELSYDKWNKQLDNVYRVDSYVPQFNMKSDGMTVEEGQLFKDQLPEVNNVTLVGHWYSRNEKLIGNGARRFYEDKIIIADKNFFDVFPYQLIMGNKKTALQAPDAIILSNSISKKLFGNENPVGRPVRIDEKADYVVSGVFEAPPTPSQLTFDVILSYNQRKISQLGNNISYNTYLYTRSGTDTAVLNKQLTSLYAARLADKYHGKKAAKNTDRIFVEPVQQIHLHSEMDNHDEWKGMMAASLLSVLILLIACINYTNLSVATSFRRAKEMGVRKVMGSSPRQLAVQFLTETFLMCFIAFFIALILAELSLPAFNHMLQLNLSGWHSYQPVKIPVELIIILLIVTILSGGYPAFVISSFAPARVLKGDTAKNVKGKHIRSLLLVIQFSISIIFIAGMLIIYRQIHYLKTKDVGFNPQQVIAIKTQQEHSFTELITLKNELKQFPQVAGISVTSSVFGDALAFFPYKFKGGDGLLGASYVDNDFFKTLGISLLQGRFFSGSFAGDSVSNVIVNETAAKKLGIKQLNGQQISLGGPPSTIIGIIKDYDSQGFEEEVWPTMYYSSVPTGNVRAMLLVKINAKDAAGAISRLEKAWSSFEPGFPMRYVFLDQEFGKYFIKYQRLGNLFFLFTIISVMIALMGLFALAAFMTEQRIKEIGIRKVLGASLNDILQLLNRDFVRLVIIANVIAWPVTYLLARRWLNGFAYRIHIPVMALMLATSASIVITILTVSIQAWRAAMANPIKALRSE